jgi:GT2 family glycosyltransferase
MKGEYFSWLSHDDKYEPKKIEKQINLLLKQNDKKLLALCGSRQIDKDSKFLYEKRKIHFNGDEVVSWEEALTYLLKNGVYGGCEFLIPKTAFDECGGFDENLRYTQDAFMWMKMFLNGYGIVYDDSPDSLTRIHNGQLTQTGRALYHQNCETMNAFLLPEFVKVTTKENKILYYYGKNNAKKANKIVWKSVLKEGKNKKLLTCGQRLKIRLTAIYGGVRPTIRKIYYRVFKKVKTQ